MAKLDPEQKDSYDLMRTVVDNGYELHYDWITSYIYDGSSAMSSKESLEVFDILEMFDFLGRAYENIVDKSGIEETWIKFAGFDGNRETKYMVYTRFLMEQEERFSWLLPDKRYNSHMPILDFYRAMVNEWKASNNRHALSKDDVIRIISVWDNRS